MPKRKAKARATRTAEPPDAPVQPVQPPAGRKTCIQISPALRDRLWRLKFRKTYEEFLSELCDAYEGGSAMDGAEGLPIPGK
ncbi:MAG: hypothetical protein HZB92_00880 [Euryarchaeota archaeon]|nr:hypothetical protein [Euryarchaeota archaeon]